MYARHTDHDVGEVIRLSGSGLSDYEVSRRTGVARSTVCRWRRAGPPFRARRPCQSRPSDPAAYSYLLGTYLGDGCIQYSSRGSTWLRIYLDARYPGIVAECAEAMRRSTPVTVRLYDRINPGAIVVHATSRSWLALFPQHGPGRKHLRTIVLEPWQREITEHFPRELLRGLIHSDGARCINRFSVRLPSGRVGKYAYPRYFFSNLSADIRGIFCEHCELLGIRWTQSNPRNISVSHRDSVALLDEFVGPKR
jgi:hypothetical protein